MSKSPSSKHPKRDDPFIEALAQLLVPMGMPPIAAKMQGYIMLSAEPLSLDQLVEGMGVSKSSASVAARLLERYGVLRCFTAPGTKRVRYGMAGYGGGFLLEQMRFIGAMAELLQRTSVNRPDAAARLSEMGAFYGRIHEALNSALSGQ